MKGTCDKIQLFILTETNTHKNQLSNHVHLKE